MSAQNLFSRIISSLPSIYPFSSKTSDKHTINSSASFKQVSPTISSEKGGKRGRVFFPLLLVGLVIIIAPITATKQVAKREIIAKQLRALLRAKSKQYKSWIRSF